MSLEGGGLETSRLSEGADDIAPIIDGGGAEACSGGALTGMRKR